MNMPGDMPTADSALWTFSLAFYRRPGVAAALIVLQDRTGLDVNLVLFALWFGLSGRGRLDPPALAAADREIETLRRQVIQPLRALRRELKADVAADVQRLRDQIKKVEIDAEKAALERLAKHAGRVTTSEPAKCLTDAKANLARYLGPEAAQSPEASVIRDAIDCSTGQWFNHPRPVRPSA